MNLQIFVLALGFAATLCVRAHLPENLVAEGIPPIPEALRLEAGRYLEFRSASFQGWHPHRREMLVITRFAETDQLHRVQRPGGARTQLTFLPEPVRRGSFRPKTGDCIVFEQDLGGGEFFQLFRLDSADGRITLLTDGTSRNVLGPWSRSGKQLAYTSTRRTGRDTDLYVMDPGDPKSDRLLLELKGGGWSASDWSPDESQLLVREYISINESYLYLANVSDGTMELITPKTDEKIAWRGGLFALDGRSIFVPTDKDAEFARLCRYELETRQLTPLELELPWNIDDLALSDDGKTLACVSNQDGVSVLHLLDTATGQSIHAPRLPSGSVTGLAWHDNNRDLAFTLSSARSPGDAWSLDTRIGTINRWTESETGGLNPASFVEPELIRIESFDGLSISAFVYRPDPKKFPGPRPVLISIHGGPEAQSRPVFQGRINYYMSELGIAVIYPNVRGSDGYGKTFLTLDNGMKREDSVQDIGTLLHWVRHDLRFDAGRIGVMGGSYGGYMVLASMTHYNELLRCGINVVGISNFLTFLKNTQDYRRDLRRAEYGDERDPAMAAFLERISPTRNVEKISKPMLVVQGKNDPRVPVTESEQMVKALKDQGNEVWYLMAKDEGHGFRKKRNVDVQFLSTILFVRKHLLGGAP